MTIWVIWFVVALILLIAELFTPGFLLASFSVGCFFSGAVALLGAGIILQLIVFIIITIIVFFTIRPLALKHLNKGDDLVKTNVDALLEKTGLVTERIDGLVGTGRVKVGGEDWRADAVDDSTIETGSRVRVVRVEGITLKVQPEERNGG